MLEGFTWVLVNPPADTEFVVYGDTEIEVR